MHSWFKSIRQNTNQLGNTLLILSHGGLFESHIKVTTFPPPQMCLFLNVSLQLKPPTRKRTACHLQWNECQQCKVPEIRKVFKVESRCARREGGHYKGVFCSQNKFSIQSFLFSPDMDSPLALELASCHLEIPQPTFHRQSSPPSWSSRQPPTPAPPSSPLPLEHV